jgi:hypothetical protein
LYNLATDIGETTNVLSQNKGIARDLSTALRSYLLGVSAQMPLNKFTLTAVAPPPVVFLPGDYDGDGLINIADYNTWRSTLGNSITAGLGADGNGNGFVDAGDFVVWRNIMSGPGSGSGLGDGSVAVPEPGTAVLFTIGLLTAAFPTRRRRNS